ncbi:lysophospholipid acyltransferase family protein [Deinococcus maricopensis]|uniref:Phospholipid/glycerol acyltransferase n=1 Tax=Deinococcus maricopensis (strain DSM 21211 / LMG 22137 / NRRL B-23946 / LB-34) TaxID=709986 RepID=E8U4F8_DEIML|nr:lysophospholipid acyltransferase family protein [Deinococcus maricopensis]ADV68823.1 phospholipid/glycerol acyltransferase [Deinococcus maricopensis DSM 21211]
MTAPAPKDAGIIPINPFLYNLVVFATSIPMHLQGRLRVEGLEHVPLSGRVIIAGNHVTALDPFVIANAIPRPRRIQFMAKKEIFRNPIIGGIVRGGGSFPVDRQSNDVGAIRNAIKVLNAEGMLGIFPEGTRGGGEMNGGVALIALRGKAPIVPVGLRLHRRVWTVRFGPPLPPQGTIKTLTAELGEAIQQLVTA